jgi:predicted ArsR family transcriptional regulator
MSPALHPGDRDLLAILMRLGPSGIAELCTASNVTATAVRQRLQRLQALGFVQRRAVPADRGRPHHVYEATDTARRELGQNYAELATLLWEEMRQIEDAPTRERLLGRVRKAMVEQFRGRVTASSPRERMTELATALNERGFQVEAASRAGDPEDLPVLREHTCPYHEIASQDTSICELEQAVFAEVVGSPLELTHCCQRGDRVCEFDPGAKSIPNSGMAHSAVRV